MFVVCYSMIFARMISQRKKQQSAGQNSGNLLAMLHAYVSLFNNSEGFGERRDDDGEKGKKMHLP